MKVNSIKTDYAAKGQNITIVSWSDGDVSIWGENSAIMLSAGEARELSYLLLEAADKTDELTKAAKTEEGGVDDAETSSTN